jgi:hypothetical protein
MQSGQTVDMEHWSDSRYNADVLQAKTYVHTQTLIVKVLLSELMCTPSSWESNSYEVAVEEAEKALEIVPWMPEKPFHQLRVQ